MTGWTVTTVEHVCVRRRRYGRWRGMDMARSKFERESFSLHLRFVRERVDGKDRR